MQKLKLDKDKALAFVVGLVYGYKNTYMELKVLPIEYFTQENHREDKVYYINREEGRLYNNFTENITHICVLREDRNEKKVVIFIYKRKKAI